MGQRRQSEPALPLLRRFGAPHRRWFVTGLAGTLAWVAFRLLMPWPLKGVIEAAFPGHGAVETQGLRGLGDPVLQLCAAYFVCALGLGVSELVQRGGMGRFATRTVEDLREAALRGASRKLRAQEVGAGGDLIARLIGDAARLRDDLRGLCVNACQNALLFVAIVVLVMVLSPHMGVFFLLGGSIAAAIGYRASLAGGKSAGRQRANEGAYAGTLEAALAQGNLALAASADVGELEEDEDSVGSGIWDAPTLHIHVVLALTVVAALLAGIAQVRAGELSPGHVFIFVAYALTVHRRLVQVGRQLGRMGKVRASLDRLATLLYEEEARDLAPVVRPLFSELRVVQGRLDSARGHGDSPRLRTFDLAIPAGSSVAVVGKPGAGKSSLLRTLAGIESLAEGALYWDDAPLDGPGRPSLAFLPQDPLFPPQKVRQVLGLDATAELTPEQTSVLDSTDAAKVIARLPRGLGDKVGSLQLSKQEGRALGLAAILLGSASVWVLDAPFEGQSRKAVKRRLGEILARGRGRTVIVSMAKPLFPERFDRIVELKRGKLVFAGTPAQWTAWKSAPDEEASCEG